LAEFGHSGIFGKKRGAAMSARVNGDATGRGGVGEAAKQKTQHNHTCSHSERQRPTRANILAALRVCGWHFCTGLWGDSPWFSTTEAEERRSYSPITARDFTALALRLEANGLQTIPKNLLIEMVSFIAGERVLK